MRRNRFACQWEIWGQKSQRGSGANWDEAQPGRSSAGKIGAERRNSGMLTEPPEARAGQSASPRYNIVVIRLWSWCNAIYALTSTASTRAEWSKRSSPLTRPHNQIRGSDSEKCRGGFGGIWCHGGSFICRASPDAICCSVCKPKSEQGTWKDFNKYPLEGSFPSARNLSEYFRVCKKMRGSICRLSTESSMTCFEDQILEWSGSHQKAFILSLISFWYVQMYQ